jgi:hypothetical protein
MRDVADGESRGLPDLGDEKRISAAARQPRHRRNEVDYRRARQARCGEAWKTERWSLAQSGRLQVRQGLSGVQIISSLSLMVTNSELFF